jgi:hypothetical protein
MNARNALILSLIVVFTAISAAQAAPAIGTNKARGIYNSGGLPSQRIARSQYRAPTRYYRAPTAQVAPAPMVAQVPAEGRRFSYAPAPSAAASVPCPPAQAATAAPAAEGDRRFSYAPVPETTVAPAPAPRVYSAQPSYSGRRVTRSTVDRWALPKTDPRKYSTR